MSHFYSLKGDPCHFVPKKDGSGNRPSTIADCRKNGWLPSVTEILKVAARPQLERWKLIQACTAVLTSPRGPTESLDQFFERVLFVDKEQDEEAAKAADLGSRLHAAIETTFREKGGERVNLDLWPWIDPAITAILPYGKVHSVETILIGNGYGGMCDLILETPECWWIFDWKTTKKLPSKTAWPEHVIQCAAYAAAFQKRCSNGGIDSAGNPIHICNKPIRTANCYISTVEQGKFVICEHDPDWQKVYNSAFLPLLQYWKWVNGYNPLCQ